MQLEPWQWERLEAALREWSRSAYPGRGAVFDHLALFVESLWPVAAEPDPWADVPNMRPVSELRQHEAVLAPQFHPVRVCPFCPTPAEPDPDFHPNGQAAHEAAAGPDMPTDARALAARLLNGCQMRQGHLCACPAAPYEYAGCWVRQQARPLNQPEGN